MLEEHVEVEDGIFARSLEQHETNANPLRAPIVAIIDNRSLAREGVAVLLEQSKHFRVFAVSSAEDLLNAQVITSVEVTAILLNVGLECVLDPTVQANIAKLLEKLPGAPLILLSDQQDSSQHIREALQQGVRGYFPTTLPHTILIRAVQLVQAGGTFVPADVLTHALSQGQFANATASTNLHDGRMNGLTPRQLQVLDLLRQGKANKIIAYELSMQESTVKVHVRHIMRKMHASNRTQAAFLASASQPCAGDRCDSCRFGRVSV